MQEATNERLPHGAWTRGVETETADAPEPGGFTLGSMTVLTLALPSSAEAVSRA